MLRLEIQVLLLLLLYRMLLDLLFDWLLLCSSSCWRGFMSLLQWLKGLLYVMRLRIWLFCDTMLLVVIRVSLILLVLT